MLYTTRHFYEVLYAMPILSERLAMRTPAGRRQKISQALSISSRQVPTVRVEVDFDTSNQAI